MNKIFLSHSSKDKEAVRRFKQDLESYGFNVWFDEDEIGIGDEIIASIQDGLQSTNYLIIWLTKHAIESGWVAKEWQSKLNDGIKLKKTLVLPVLAEDCDIPLFLSSKRYADFREGYKKGLNILIRDLRKKTKLKISGSVYQCVIGLIKDLEYAKIYIPYKAPIKIIEHLRFIPRTGKYIRLNKYKDKIRVRTVYDHIITLARIMDMLNPIIDHNLDNSEIVELAMCIVYHDLCEAVLGDIPAYTNLPLIGSNNRLTAERLLRRWDSKTLKRTANDYISLFLEDREIQNLEYTTDVIYGKPNKIGKYFHLIDKVDPIIAIWRYIDNLRDRNKFDIDSFLNVLKDFFENKKVKQICRNFKSDRRILFLVNKLQDRQLARQYYFDPRVLENIISESKLPLSLTKLIFGIDLFYSKQIYSKPKNRSHYLRTSYKKK